MAAAVLLKEFVYKDKPRKVYEMVPPINCIGGIEVTAMPPEDQEAFLKLVGDFHENLASYVTKYYRRFDPAKAQPLQ